MGNMSYCRFQNTLEDLSDCYDYLFEEVGEDEAKARARLVKLCHRIAADCTLDEIDELPKEAA